MGREIFAQRIAGQSCKAIADGLNSTGVLSPMEYKRAQGMNYKSGYRVHSKAQWSAVSVRRILQNEVYLNSELARTETAKKGAMEDYLGGLLSREDYERLKKCLRWGSGTPEGAYIGPSDGLHNTG